MNNFKCIDSDNMQFVRDVSDNMRISVLNRMTGFGFYEWETGIRTKNPDSFRLVSGDRRDELNDLSEADVQLWYEEHRFAKPSAFVLLRRLKEHE